MAVTTSDRARELRAKEIEEALATGRLEGLEPSAGAMGIFQRYIEGELTAEELRAALDEYADREYGPVRLPGNERS